MLRQITCIIIGLLVFGSHINAQKLNIVLGRPTQNSITLSLLFDQNVDFYVEYGTQKGNYTLKSNSSSCQANIPLEFEIGRAHV